tara:strand:+ start:177 stop:557 length:381 start_codon:yes stop_codon:yes gene_type:complete
METSLALSIIGGVLILVGVLFNAIPKVVNQKVMGDLAEEAVNPAAALRTVIGGSAFAIGFIALFCRNLPVEQATTLLIAMAIGMIVVMSTIILIKFRGFADDIAVPPVIMFIILIAIALYGAGVVG